MCLSRYSKTHQKFMTSSSKVFKLDELIEEWSVDAYERRDFIIFCVDKK